MLDRRAALEKTNAPLGVGRRVFLRVLDHGDYAPLRAFEYLPQNIATYRHRGVTLSPEDHAASLWQGVLCQFLICSRVDGNPLGIVAAFGYDPRNQNCHIAVGIFPQPRQTAWALEGVAVFLDYLFRVFPMHKIYATVTEPTLSSFRSAAGAIFDVEAVLTAHEYLEGRYVDTVILAMSRARWDAVKISMGAGQSAGI